MPFYPIVNIKTGEEKSLQMSIDDWVKWREENKNEWKRDWSKGCAATVETGEWKDKLIKKNPGWNEILQKASKAGGSQTKISKI